MEQTEGSAAFSEAAKDVEAGTPAPEPAKRRSRKKAATAEPPAPAQEAPAVEIRLDVKPEQLHAAMGAFLDSMAKVTNTAPPSKDETKGMADTLSWGLSHTKLGMDEKSGPWVPLGIAVTLYVLPRALEKLMDVAERRRAPERGTFRRPLGAVPPGVPQAAAAAENASPDGPVQFKGTVSDE